MGIVTSDLLAGLRTNFQAILIQALGDKAGNIADAMKFATLIPSTTETESLNWFGITPPMSEWKDKRKLNGLLPYVYSLKNKDWESSLEIDRNAILDDKMSMIPPRIRGLAGAYYRAVNREIFKALDLAYSTSLLAYDAGVFFADTRVIGASANIDNYLSGNYSDSETEIRTALNEGYQAMAAYQDDWGEPLNLTPDTIVCAPGMKLSILQALSPGVAGVIRPEAAVIKPENVIASPWIKTNAKDWFLLCTSEELKPILFQKRQDPQFNSIDTPANDSVFMSKKYLYGVDARFVVGFGDPRTAIMYHNT